MLHPGRLPMVKIIALVLFTIALDAAAAPINFAGQVDVVNVNSGGIYSMTPPGTTFVGVIDDVTFGGSISNGTTMTPFSCCIAAGGLGINNNTVLDQEFADLLNLLLGSNMFAENDVVDTLDIEGDAMTAADGRIEVGLSWILDADAFPDNNPNNYPFDPADVILNVFFILEEDEFGTDIYDVIGVVTGVPLPAAAWLFPAGLVAGLGWMRRRISSAR